MTLLLDVLSAGAGVSGGAGLWRAGRAWWTRHRARALAHADDVLAATGLAEDPEPFWHAALAQVPAGVREELLPEAERLATRLAAPAAPTVERPALSPAQRAGRFTEDVGGILVIPDGTVPMAQAVPEGTPKGMAVLRVDRHGIDQVRASGVTAAHAGAGLHQLAELAVHDALAQARQAEDQAARLLAALDGPPACQCPGCGTIPHA